MSDAPELAWRFDLGNRLGECVLWDDLTQTAHWTDIEAATFWSWPFGASAPSCVPVADRLSSFGLTEQPGRFVGAFAKEFALFSPAESTHCPLAPVEPQDPTTVMNDGRTDRSGIFWASSKMIDPDTTAARARLWRLSGCATAMPFLGKMRVPNSLAWSRNGETMYISDSESGIIWRFAFNTVQGPSRPSVFAIVEDGKPDGACVDAEDCLWVAHWGSSRVVRYRPDGLIDCAINVPARHPTCVAFGGPGLDHLMVTSERPSNNSAPADGSLLAYRTGHVGIKEARCSVPGVALELEGWVAIQPRSYGRGGCLST